MARDVTTALRNETISVSLSPILLASFDFQTSPVRVWSGYGTITYAGLTYAGLGELGSVSPIEETTDVRANGVSFQLSGVPSSLISTAMGDSYHGRAVKLYFGALSPTMALVVNPYQVFSGRMDAVEIDDGPETATIRISAESSLIDLQRNRERRFTHEDQQIMFPGDLGLQYMPTAQSTPFLWGGQKVNAAGTTRVSNGVVAGPPA